MCLFDRFHEGNVKKESGILRRLTIIKELRENINSQVIEQLHSSTKYSVRSLNDMKPVNHIFLMRSMLDHRNLRKKRV